MQNSKMFKTRLVSLQTIGENRFVIPTYQRPYVWKEEQVKNLMAGFINAFEEDSTQPYFLGTVITSERENAQELIDGQQRFTTLWLIAVVFNKKKISSDLVKFLRLGDQLRLGFEIRKEVENYFDFLVKSPLDALERYTEEELQSSPYLKDISAALATIEGIIDPLTESYQEDLGNYIYTQVYLVRNEAPAKIDLNKLFATLNNSGVQLEQTDIVKANLLKCIKTEKVLYGKIWEACENMDNFFVRNVRKLFSNTNWGSLETTHFNQFDPNIFVFEAGKNEKSEEKEEKDKIEVGEGMGIREIIRNLDGAEKEDNAKGNAAGSENEIDCESIISFGQFLLHAYRVFLKIEQRPDIEGNFHENRLIEVFRNLENLPENGPHGTREARVKAFFQLLWRLRYVFDTEVIKWLWDLNGKTRQLELSMIRRQKSESESGSDITYYFNPEKITKKSARLMLQSVLYFTGDYRRQYWLTPYLYRLLHQDPENGKPPLEILESIDNMLSVSLRTDKEASYALCDPNYSEDEQVAFEDELKQSDSTKTRHYWFQKLEYILWKTWNKDDPKIKEFRITSKNSVEHVFPQNHEFRIELEKDYLNSFGNLGLLNVGQNSSYSNQDVGKKKIDFGNKNTYDSLKLAKIYSSDVAKWEEGEIAEHQEEMIGLLLKHYYPEKYAQ